MEVIGVIDRAQINRNAGLRRMVRLSAHNIRLHISFSTGPTGLPFSDSKTKTPGSESTVRIYQLAFFCSRIKQRTGKIIDKIVYDTSRFRPTPELSAISNQMMLGLFLWLDFL